MAVKITASCDTWLKKEPVDSSKLSDDEKVFVPRNKEYFIVEALIYDKKHTRVALSHHAGVWFVFSQHWKGLTPQPKPETKPPVGVVIPPDRMGPTAKPHDYGFKSGDYHFIADDVSEELTCYDYDGNKLFVIPCLCRGLDSDYTFTRTGSDTPPGLYKLGVIYRDYEISGKDRAQYSRERMAYGWYSIDMVSLDKAEDRAGRAGIMLHGGGSGCGWPGAWNPRQTLYPTLGCIRVHNADLRDKVVPLYDKGTTIFVSVLQEAGSR